MRDGRLADLPVVSEAELCLLRFAGTLATRSYAVTDEQLDEPDGQVEVIPPPPRDLVFGPAVHALPPAAERGYRGRAAGGS
jgi:hypothetical protein